MNRFQNEFFGKTDLKHDQLVVKCVSQDGMEKIINAVDANTWVLNQKDDQCDLKVDYETEVICQSHGYKSNFILGYADIVIKILNSKHEIKWNEEALARKKKLMDDFYVPEAEANRSVRAFYEKEGGISTAILVNILVECKPELTDIGTTIRQIKTYESVLMDQRIKLYKAIATYSDVPKDVIDYLEHEGIKVVKF